VQFCLFVSRSGSIDSSEARSERFSSVANTPVRTSLRYAQYSEYQNDAKEVSMTDIPGDIERTLLREAAHLLPDKLRKVIEVAAVSPPETPHETIPAPSDPAAARLAQIEHVVVVMLENRSFDHMLGYLSLPSSEGGKGRDDVDGLQGRQANLNMLDGTPYPIHQLDYSKFKDETEDPDHSGHSVEEQLANKNGGFVENLARISSERAAKEHEQPPDPGLVMGYFTGSELPVYDHLAAEYCVVDRWFSSVPGATWPNRLYSIAGQAAGTPDDVSPPLYELPSFPRYLDQHKVNWRWYSFDPGTLRAVDPAYRLSNHHRFAFVDSRKLSTAERAAGVLMEEGPSLLDDIAKGELPTVSWIDPRFKDLRVLGPDSNDDHPPSDVTAGQDLILTITTPSVRPSPGPRHIWWSPTTSTAASTTTSRRRPRPTTIRNFSVSGCVSRRCSSLPWSPKAQLRRSFSVRTSTSIPPRSSRPSSPASAPQTGKYRSSQRGSRRPTTLATCSWIHRRLPEPCPTTFSSRRR
jgi:hypothetical protein